MPMNVYVYRAALYSEQRGMDIKAELRGEVRP